MKGKSWSIPVGMIFKKHYCHHCGNKLEKEKNHRIVSKDDLDYYKYHDFGNYPRYDYDVYSYHFKCPSCNNRISYKEQCIIKRIQKTIGNNLVSSSEIKSLYKEAKAKDDKSFVVSEIIIFTIFISIFFLLFYFLSENKTLQQKIVTLICFILITTFMVISFFKSHKGKNKLRHKQGYSYEKENLLKKLHAYSYNNKEKIMHSGKCYCFYCKKEMEAKEINKYIDNDSTALCPYCEIDSIIPDSIDENINSSIIDEMNKYWF